MQKEERKSYTPPKYIQSQTRKMLSAYGGVGSILETSKGAMKVEPFDEWKFFKDTARVFDQLYHYDMQPNTSLGNMSRNLLTKLGSPTTSISMSSLGTPVRISTGTNYMIHYLNPTIRFK